MGNNRFKKFIIAGISCLLFLPTATWADALGGAIFAQSTTVQANTQLILGLSNGSTFTLNTTDSELQACGSGVNCKDPNGNTVTHSPNQGAWGNADAFNTTGNAVYLAGTSGGIAFRDFFAFDLAKFKDYLALNGQVSVTSATLAVTRFGYLGEDYVGINFNPVAGNDSNGNPVSAYNLTDLSDFDANYFAALGGSGLYGSYKVWNTDPTSDPTQALLFALAGGKFLPDFNSALGNANDSQGHDFLVIGGSTFDSSSTDPTPIAPTAAVPEPASLFLIGSGLVGIFNRRKKK